MTLFGVIGALTAGAGLVGYRSVRWQFLLRGVGVRRPVRDVVAVSAGSDALGVVTPGAIGMLLRIAWLGLTARVRWTTAAGVAMADLGCDVAALAMLEWMMGPPGVVASGWILAVGLGAWIAGLALAGIRPEAPARSRIETTLWAFGATMAAWAIVALLLAISGGSPLPSDWIAAVLASTIPAAAAGTPAMVLVGVGLVGGLVAGGRVIAKRRQAGSATVHFDQIAADYLKQWPPHIWEMLMGRRLGLLAEAVGDAEGAGTGLDLGCGLGLQAASLRAKRYQVLGLDFAKELLRGARQQRVPAVQGSAMELPIKSGSLGFAYSIGVLHHLPSPGAQIVALREAARVLRPGGVLVVQETNPRNPLFRFHMGYTFPWLKLIDEGTEWWIPDGRWHSAAGFEQVRLVHFTFLPDFLPEALLGPLQVVERWLERSRFRSLSAHYMVVLKRTG